MSALEGREVVIVEAARTPIGRGHAEKGYYKDTHPNVLLGAAYRAVIERAGIDPGQVENVIAGCVQQFGPQGLHVGRNAWLQAGYPIETSATTIDLQCGSAQQAVNLAASQIASGVHDIVIGGGVEHMGMLPFSAGMKTQQDFGFAFTPELMAQHNIVGQGLGAEMIAAEYEIPRSEVDELAVRSHRLAHQATEEGRFEREIIPMQVNGDTYVTDQGIRPGTDLETLAGLKTVFKEDGVVTAGNASQISDGAAAVLLMSAAKAAELGLTPRAKVIDQTTVGCDPVKMLEGPIPATAKILERNSMSIDDIDLFEVNEAFAPVVAAWKREHKPGHGPRQRQRRRDGARAPARLHRRPPDHDAAARARALRQGDRVRDDVLRRRPRHRHPDPAGLRPVGAPGPGAARRARARSSLTTTARRCVRTAGPL